MQHETAHFDPEPQASLIESLFPQQRNENVTVVNKYRTLQELKINTVQRKTKEMFVMSVLINFWIAAPWAAVPRWPWWRRIGICRRSSRVDMAPSCSPVGGPTSAGCRRPCMSRGSCRSGREPGEPQGRLPATPPRRRPRGGDGGAVVRRCRRDEVVQEEMKGKDGAGQAKDAQCGTLEPGEAANIVQDVLEPHGAVTRGGDGRPQPAISGRIISSSAARPGGGLRGRRWGNLRKAECVCCECVKDFIADSLRTFNKLRRFNNE